MGNILDIIVENKKREVEAKSRFDAGKIEQMASRCLTSRHSMKKSLCEAPYGIIAEFKRRSPSKGEIHPLADVRSVVPGYASAGAAACSILTDTRFFGGAITDLCMARELVSIPLLRKDFVVNDYQVYEAACYGADAILLIAAVLSKSQIEQYTALAHSLGMEVLFEVHDYKDIEKFTPDIDMVGVNNRNLTTFHTNPALSADMARILPDNVVKVAESGLTSIEEVRDLQNAGYTGFLIGESFMKHDDPAKAFADFLDYDK